MKRTPFRRHIIVVAATVVIIAAIVAIARCTENEAHLTTPKTISASPTQIKQIRDIGQWEFLSIDMEELVDTIDKKMIGSRRLARIYYGTMRLGFDTRAIGKKDIAVHGDTVEMTIPPITLLDRNFIDEARTVSFFEAGSWSHTERKQLRRRAYSKMYARGMTRKNIENARNNAVIQMRQLLRAMGFNTIEIRTR